MQKNQVQPTIVVVGAPKSQHGHLAIVFSTYRLEHINALDDLPRTPDITFQAVLLWEQELPANWHRVGVSLMTATAIENPRRPTDNPQVTICEIIHGKSSALCRYPLDRPCGFITRSEVTWASLITAHRFGGFIRSQRKLREALAAAA